MVQTMTSLCEMNGFIACCHSFGAVRSFPTFGLKQELCSDFVFHLDFSSSVHCSEMCACVRT